MCSVCGRTISLSYGRNPDEVPIEGYVCRRCKPRKGLMKRRSCVCCGQQFLTTSGASYACAECEAAIDAPAHLPNPGGSDEQVATAKKVWAEVAAGRARIEILPTLAGWTIRPTV